ncbi:SRPBCC family protein [Streptomyces sp. NA02950]|uniref:nuclear transport factor 2 family protein n=1 Tax=Streptomyces sp. NA02950 TaxID=2742137 RepID=UPI001592940D|nr:nuclear transport factor 2 family protein [Streptomyces sp. NA02950]QKV93065.1 SRPBCC family protein [Streptomyces sp. NA02950]
MSAEPGGRPVHHAEHDVTVRAPADIVFGIVSDFAQWPRFFPETVHIEPLGTDGGELRLQIWRAPQGASGEVKTWVSRVRLDSGRRSMTFRQERSSAPLAALSGEWHIEPLDADRSRIVLTHAYQVIDESFQAGLDALIDRNSDLELGHLRDAAEQDHLAGGLVVTAGSSAELPLAAEDLYGRLSRMDPDDTTVRVGVPGRRIAERHFTADPLLTVSTSVLELTPTTAGVRLTARRHAVLAPRASEGTSIDGIKDKVRTALRAEATMAVQQVREQVGGGTDPVLYIEVVQFYARQAYLLDSGEAERWADTFTEDGRFVQNARPEPWIGRDQIRKRMRAGLDRIFGEGLQRRHWLGMVDLVSYDDETVTTRYYAAIYSTAKDGAPQLYLSTAVDDVLVRTPQGLKVRHRLVSHDNVR